MRDSCREHEAKPMVFAVEKHYHVQLEMISTDGCEIKTTVMTLANHNSQKQHNKPIRIGSQSM